MTSITSADRAPHPSGLADVLDLVLDKGIVIDAYVRLSVVGIELLTLDARVVIASVDTYLRFAEAVNRLDLGSARDATGVPAMAEKAVGKATESGARHVVHKKTSGVAGKVEEKIEGVAEKLRPGSRSERSRSHEPQRQRQ